jgi:hypothetical protein
MMNYLAASADDHRRGAGSVGRRIGCRDGERGEKKHGRSRRDRMKCPSFF